MNIVDRETRQLTAAAPDLLEALKAILANHETVGAGASIFQCTTAQVNAARAAIAKAEPRQPSEAEAARDRINRQVSSLAKMFGVDTDAIDALTDYIRGQ